MGITPVLTHTALALIITPFIIIIITILVKRDWRYGASIAVALDGARGEVRPQDPVLRGVRPAQCGVDHFGRSDS